MSSKIYIDNIDKIYDERNRIYIIDDKGSDERYQISENDKNRLTEDMEFLKVVTLISQKNIENVDK